MGQAKNRGSFEQRQSEAVIRNKALHEQRVACDYELMQAEQNRVSEMRSTEAGRRILLEERQRLQLAVSMMVLSGMVTPAAPSSLNIGGRYNWRGQPERLVYMGRNWSGNGYWHQFEKVDEPGKIWCEVTDNDLPSFEETVP